MKIFYFYISMVSLFVISCTGQSKKSFPVFALDDQHNQIQKDDSKVIPKYYELKTSEGFILDCSKYDFSLIKTMNDNKLPDKVSILAKGGTFTTKLNTVGETVFDNSTLESSDDKNKKFTGFVQGDTAMLVIGSIKNNEMISYWLGMITVK
jgi:hypothetical protein